MSKKVGIFFLFLANAILLVHAIIPHHHYNGHSHLYHGPECMYHANPADKDFHFCIADFSVNSENSSGHNSLADCILDYVYVRFANPDNTLQSSDSDVEYLLSLVCNNPENIVLPIPLEGSLLFRQKPFIDILSSLYLISPAGLRAPPLS